MDRAFCLVLLSALLVVPSGSLAQEAAKPAQELPGNVHFKWHPGGADRFTLVRTEFDAKTRKVTFLVEAKADLSLKAHDFDIHLFDADKVRIHIVEANQQRLEGGIMELSASEDGDGQGFMRWSFVKGERLRLSFELPDATVWERIRHAVVGGRSLPTE
jgi:hypothetical protein